MSGGGDLGPPAATGGLAALPGSRRLAVGAFLVVLLGFYGAAQVQLWLAAGGGAFPGPREVLVRYHGDPLKSRLHLVLDPDRAPTDPKRMYGFLGDTDEAQATAHGQVLRWVEAGAPRDGWPAVAPVFTGATTCGNCHARGADAEGLPRVKADLPFETYEDVLPSTERGAGMPLGELSTTTHNHLFGFAVLSLLVSWIFTATRWRGPLVPLLVGAAFAGTVLDVACWWLTRAYGAPFHLGVILGGGLFGAAIVAMVVLALDEVALRGVVGRVLRPPLVALRLARRDA